MHASPLSLELRRLSGLLRDHGRSRIALSPEACVRISAMLTAAAWKADDLEARTGDAEELEDELLIVAGAATFEPETSYQAALKAQQADIQRQLDRGGPDHVSRPGLAALSARIGDSNVFSFPRAPQPAAYDDGGDAA